MRAVVATGVVLLVTLVGAGAAWACNEPYISVSPASAGPGDTVSWTVGNVEPRARYTVTIAGRVVASSEAGASAPTGTFTMPDLGAGSRTLFVELSVTHGEASTTHEGSYNGTGNPDSLVYRAPAASPQPPPATEPAPPPPAPPESGAGLGTNAPQEQTRKRNRAGGQPGGFAPRPGVPAAPKSAPHTPSGAQSAASVGDGEVSESGEVGVEAGADARERSASRSSDRARATSPTVPAPQPVRRLPSLQSENRTTASVDKDGDLQSIVAVSLSIVVLLGFAGVAIWTLRRRGSAPTSRIASDGPQWVPPGLGLEALNSDLVIEAELQQLIAEERARHLANEGELVRAGPADATE